MLRHVRTWGNSPLKKLARIGKEARAVSCPSAIMPLDHKLPRVVRKYGIYGLSEGIVRDSPR
jgi:hypothetical protein